MTASLTDLLTESRQLGFLGPGPVEEHIAHALAFTAAVPDAPARALDLGAGGGLPGLVLAISTWPGTRWVFLDAQERRVAFLEGAVHAAGLDDRVEVVLERAEAYARRDDARSTFDLVVARSFAGPPVTAECAAPLLRVGGLLVVSEPPATAVSERWPRHGTARVGLGPAEAVEVAGRAGADPTHLARLPLEQATEDRYPRRVGVPAKRPLF